MNLIDCILECAKNEDFVRAYDRLCHASLSKRETSINHMIDKATGKLDDDALGFINFVYECVWLRLPPEARE